MSSEPKSGDFTASPLAEQPDVVPATARDLEGQVDGDGDEEKDSISAFKALGWLDRFLALWIFLAMAIGIILGNFVPSTGPALQKGKFVGVSVPIGMYLSLVVPRSTCMRKKLINNIFFSRWPPSHDVPDPMQGPIRVAPQASRPALYVEADTLQRRCKLGCSPVPDGKLTLPYLPATVSALCLDCAY